MNLEPFRELGFISRNTPSLRNDLTSHDSTHAGPYGVVNVLYTRGALQKAKHTNAHAQGLAHVLQLYPGMANQSLRECVANVSQGGGQGMTKCSCLGLCNTKKCGCFKEGRVCNSRCHPRNVTCTNCPEKHGGGGRGVAKQGRLPPAAPKAKRVPPPAEPAEPAEPAAAAKKVKRRTQESDGGDDDEEDDGEESDDFQLSSDEKSDEDEEEEEVPRLTRELALPKYMDTNLFLNKLKKGELQHMCKNQRMASSTANKPELIDKLRKSLEQEKACLERQLRKAKQQALGPRGEKRKRHATMATRVGEVPAGRKEAQALLAGGKRGAKKMQKKRR